MYVLQDENFAVAGGHPVTFENPLYSRAAGLPAAAARPGDPAVLHATQVNQINHAGGCHGDLCITMITK